MPGRHRPHLLSRRRLLALAGAAPFATLPLAGAAQAQNKPLRIVTTVSMVADAVRAVGGARVNVTSLLGEGVDPHTYRPTRADIARLSAADMVFANGLHLEAQLNEALKSIGRNRPVVFVADAVPRDRLLVDEDYKDRSDPHVWMDPTLWTFAVGAVRDALTKRDPAGRAGYEAGARSYAAELAGIDDYARKLAVTIPEKERVLITAHDAFAYFGRAYGFEVQGIQGVSTESEAGLKRIEELVTLVTTRGIKAAFFESSVPDRNVRALVEGVGARGHKLAIGGELYSDALGTPGTYEGTLIGMLDHNVTTVVRALGGNAPVRGMAGKLKAGG
jgi:manganese/zinc/iron transport system substrate-binding protein